MDSVRESGLLRNLETDRREPDSGGLALSMKRVGHRRQWLLYVFASYCVDAFILTLYAFEGTTTFTVPATYIAIATTLCATFLVLSEADLTRNSDDHYLTLWQLLANGALHMIYAEAAPELAFQFWCILFIVYGFASLRLTAREAWLSLVLVGVALLAFFVFDDHRIGIPSATRWERAITALFLLLTFARCVALGLYANRLRESLYRRSRQLRTAVQRIEELAEVDELTGLLNRRSIMRTLDAEIARCRRAATPSCIALIDLDWFKAINDKHGHPAGDEVLRTFAINVFANIRTIDRLGRYGGEEFMLVLPETSAQSAELLLNRLRVIIAALDWSDIVADRKVTFSAGVAQINPGDMPDSVIARADVALYDSKQRGRNCVKVAA